MELPKDISSCHRLLLKQEKRILSQEKRIKELESQVSMIPILLKRIEELEVRLNQNSQNSDRPPSSDGPKKQAAFPRPKGKKRGGQQGHKGSTLEMVDNADAYQFHDPAYCVCGQDLSEEIKYIKQRRQVFDLPPQKLEVTEHIARQCICPNCNRTVQGVFPKTVPSRVQYGYGVKALAVLLNTGYKIPYAKVKRFFGDLFGYKLNESTQISAQRKCYDLLESTQQVIKEKLLISPVNHFDETGIRVEGKNNWLHNCSNADYTYLFAHQKRGKKAIDSQESLLAMYQGWAVHDCWRSYFLFDSPKHAICGAHILRELQALKEQNSKWADRMRDLLLYAYHKSAKGCSTLKDFDAINRQYSRICKMAEEEEPAALYRFEGKRAKQTKGRNLLDRLINHKQAVLAFAKYEQVPFTNNQAERDIRPAKIKLKIAGSFRTFNGAKRYARIQSFISTSRKNQLNVFNELVTTFGGYNFLLAPRGAK